MIHNLNNKSVTSGELVRTVICSVLEDVQNNFDNYASVFVKDFSSFTEDERISIEKWKTKVFKKLGATLEEEKLWND